jgi:hypothetical protein
MSVFGSVEAVVGGLALTVLVLTLTTIAALVLAYQARSRVGILKKERTRLKDEVRRLDRVLERRRDRSEEILNGIGRVQAVLNTISVTSIRTSVVKTSSETNINNIFVKSPRLARKKPTTTASRTTLPEIVVHTPPPPTALVEAAAKDKEVEAEEEAAPGRFCTLF